jgi:hypothetical protein
MNLKNADFIDEWVCYIQTVMNVIAFLMALHLEVPMAR